MPEQAMVPNHCLASACSLLALKGVAQWERKEKNYMKNKVTPSESMKSFLKNKFVLVHLCYYNKISHTGQLINKRIFFPPSFRTWKVQDQGLYTFGVKWGPISLLKNGTFIRTLILSMRSLLSWLTHLLNTSPLDVMCWTLL